MSVACVLNARRPALRGPSPFRATGARTRCTTRWRRPTDISTSSGMNATCRCARRGWSCPAVGAPDRAGFRRVALWPRRFFHGRLRSGLRAETFRGLHAPAIVQPDGVQGNGTGAIVRVSAADSRYRSATGHVRHRKDDGPGAAM